jgi:hypothetical protein
MCLEEGIDSSVDCTTGRAGARKLYIAACAAVATITFSAITRTVTGITMDVGHPVPVFLEIVPEENTLQLVQTKTRNKRNINVAQQVNMIFPVATASLTERIVDMNNCCCYIGILEDNNGLRHLVGVDYDRATNTWSAAYMRTGEGSSNTGTDSTADSNEIVESLVANVSNYAPFVDSAVVIPV